MKQYSFLMESKTDPVPEMYNNVMVFKNDNLENNCQSYTLALENLIVTGDKIKVPPCKTPVDIVFDVPVGHSYPYFNWCFMKHGKFEKFTGSVESSIRKKLMSLPDNSRLFLAVTWKGSYSGHVFNSWRNGKDIYIMDACARYFGKLEDSKKYTEDVDISKSHGMLVCNPKDYDYEMRDKALKCGIKYRYTITEDKSNITPKMRFDSILDALSQFGKDNTVYRIAENGKTIGKIKTIGIDHKYGNYWTVYKYKWI